MKMIPKKMDFRNRDLVFVDLETTGLNPEVHEIIELGCVVADGPTLKVKRKYEKKIKPLNIKSADPEALKICGYSAVVWQQAAGLKEVLTEFAQFAPDAMLVGWNITFDWSFLYKAFDKFNIKPMFDYHRIDAMSIAYALLHSNNDVQKLGLRKIANSFNIELDPDVHGALEDAYATYLVFKKLMQPRMENIASE